jgi:hypothetical protein
VVAVRRGLLLAILVNVAAGIFVYFHYGVVPWISIGSTAFLVAWYLGSKKQH